MRIVADRSRCVGSGQCVLTDATIFDQDDTDGTVLILQPEPDDAQQQARARQAVRICPSQALSIAE